MGGFFKPLRRKIGVVTLLMACVFTGVWVRSLRTSDQLTLMKWNETSYVMASEHARIVFGRLSNAGISGIIGPYLDVPHDQIVSGGRLLHAADLKVEWRRQAYGFELGKRTRQEPRSSGTIELRFLIMPYWSIVTPLTLLSVWLLLSKSKSKPTSPTA